MRSFKKTESFFLVGPSHEKKRAWLHFQSGVLFMGLLNGWEVEQELGSGHQALSSTRVNCILAYGFNLRYGLLLGGLGLCERRQWVSFQLEKLLFMQNCIAEGGCLHWP